MKKNVTFCDLENFRVGYQDVHGYLSIFVCIFGSLANILNICVLRTKQMRSPTNFILTGLAIADLLVMLEYIPFVLHRNLSNDRIYASHFTYDWAKFYKFHALFGQVLHFISCSLTVMLAIWRYVYISRPQGHTMCADQRKTFLVILLTYVICPIICLPVLIGLEIKTYLQPCNETGIMILKEVRNSVHSLNLHNETIWIVRPTDPYRLSLWIYSVLLKLLPCMLLTILSYKIIKALVETMKRKAKLLGSGNVSKRMNEGGIQIYKENQADRTTKMLLIVLLLFLITEFPQAILGSISAVYGEVFLQECYVALGELMDILALTNSAINFILYCTMSRQFRVTFHDLFGTKFLSPCLISNNPKLGEYTVADTKMSLM